MGPLRQFLVVTAMAAFLVTVAAGCAHQKAAARPGPCPRTNLAKAPPAGQPTVQPKPADQNQPPRQYQGPPPSHRPPPALPDKSYSITPQRGWSYRPSQPGTARIYQRRTKAHIIFVPGPTARLRSPGLACTKLWLRIAFAGARPSKIMSSPDRLTCWFTFSQKPRPEHRGKLGKKHRHGRRHQMVAETKGKVLVKVMASDHRFSIIILGQWPTKHNRRLLKSFDRYVRGLKLVDKAKK